MPQVRAMLWSLMVLVPLGYFLIHGSKEPGQLITFCGFSLVFAYRIYEAGIEVGKKEIPPRPHVHKTLPGMVKQEEELSPN